MVKKIPFTTQALNQLYLKLAIPWVNEALRVRDMVMKEYAPTDTGDYGRSFSINDARFDWQKTVGSNVNDSEHAFWVEFGFRKTPVNRHKGPPRTESTRIYTGVGAKVMTRTVEETANDVLDLITDAINKWLGK